MKRAVTTLALAAILGAALLYLVGERDSSPDLDSRDLDGPPSAVSSAAPAAGGREPVAAVGERERELFRLLGPDFGAEQRAAVDALAARAGPAELDALARAVAALPPIPGPRYALEALLDAYAELDPAAAMALARDVDAPVELLAALHAGLARVDAEAALRALGAYDPARALRVARALLAAVGDDDAAVARLLAAAPRLDANRLRAEAAVARAPRDLVGALLAAASLPPLERRDALARIASQAAGDEAPAALRAAVALERDAGAEFSAAVLREWAKLDPAAMLDYALGLDAAAQRAALETAGFEAFAQLPPERVMAILDRLPTDVAPEVRQIELLGMARKDPLAAIRYAEGLPPGPERMRALELAARGYASADPEAALAWAQTLEPPNAAIVASVLAGFARVAPDRAIDLLLATELSSQRSSLATALVTGGLLDAEHVDALLRRWPATRGRRDEVLRLAYAWARRDPERAVDWLLANGERGADAYAAAAEALGRRDPAAAAAYLDRIPSELRATWIKAAAIGYAGADPAAAQKWLAHYADESGYDDAVAMLAQRTARSDPRAAAALLGGIDIATSQEAPAAAFTIARYWSERDAPAARRWALRLPRGGARDQALSALLRARLAAGGEPESALLGAFSSDPARQHAVADAIVALGQRDPVAARALADRYVTDPAERRNFERFIGDR
jgi:hypothetical protein